jgi:hypothetical protein
LIGLGLGTSFNLGELHFESFTDGSVLELGEAGGDVPEELQD